jgi:hypothetical protein
MKAFINCMAAIMVIIITTTTARANATMGDDTSERIQYIQQALDAGTSSARLWWDSWFGFYTVATVIPLTAALIPSNRMIAMTGNDRILHISGNIKMLHITGGLSAAQSLIGVTSMLIFPFTPRNAAEELRSMPENTPEERAKKLKKAELLLKESSEEELAGKSWIPHVYGFLINAVGAVITWKVYENKIREAGGTSWKQALTTFAIGISINELGIWTEPTQAISAEKGYIKRYHSEIDSKFLILPTENGLTFIAAIRF